MIHITDDFPGGNIQVISISDSEVQIERDLRTTFGDWFYWAFCVTGAEGKTIRFSFPSPNRIGRHGAAVSHDLVNWEWSGSRNEDSSFTYTFAEDETCVYFSHNFIYSDAMLRTFCAANDLKIETFCLTRKGREVPCFSIGEGEEMILVTSRHHCCESPGTYVLQGIAEACLKRPVPNVRFLFVPFVDYDGVMDGDQGKNRSPYDHNRDYGSVDAIYPECAKLRELADSGKILCNIDLHAPWHETNEHDWVYLLPCPEDPAGCLTRFMERMDRFASNDPECMRYNKNYNILPGNEYNANDTPNIRNYCGPRSKMKLAISMETTYFGLAEDVFSASKAITLGERLYKSLRPEFGL